MFQNCLIIINYLSEFEKQKAKRNKLIKNSQQIYYLKKKLMLMQKNMLFQMLRPTGYLVDILIIFEKIIYDALGVDNKIKKEDLQFLIKNKLKLTKIFEMESEFYEISIFLKMALLKPLSKYFNIL